MKIDSDKDGQVTIAEMKYWISHSKNRRAKMEVEERAKSYDENEDGYISWDEYIKTTYGHMTGVCIL